MNAGDGSGQLPGGVPLWRGLLAFAVGDKRLIGRCLSLLPLWAVAITFWLAMLVDPDAVSLGFVACSMLPLALVFVVGGRGVVVSMENQPELYTLVRSCAARIGGQPPARIRLTGTPAVDGAWRRGRRELRIGLPLVRCLTAEQLSVLITHELSALSHDHYWLVSRLCAQWSSAVTDDKIPGGRREALPGRLGVLHRVGTTSGSPNGSRRPGTAPPGWACQSGVFGSASSRNGSGTGSSGNPATRSPPSCAGPGTPMRRRSGGSLGPGRG